MVLAGAACDVNCDSASWSMQIAHYCMGVKDAVLPVVAQIPDSARYAKGKKPIPTELGLITTGGILTEVKLDGSEAALASIGVNKDPRKLTQSFDPWRAIFRGRPTAEFRGLSYNLDRFSPNFGVSGIEPPRKTLFFGSRFLFFAQNHVFIVALHICIYVWYKFLLHSTNTSISHAVAFWLSVQAQCYRLLLASF